MKALIYSLGSVGPFVNELQKRLTELGRAVPVTGVFDKYTEQVVRDFQTQNVDKFGAPLKVDGKVGLLTAWRLNHPFETAQNELFPAISANTIAAAGRIGVDALLIANDEFDRWQKSVERNRMKYLSPAGGNIGDNWCAAFVSWCVRQSVGSPQAMPFKYSLGARAILNECKQKGLVSGPNSGYVPVPGNIVVWWRKSPTDWRGHIGFVEDATDGFIATIEGNK